MFLEDFHCDMLDLTFPISAGGFDKDAFFKAVGIEDESPYVDDEGDTSLSISFTDRNDSSKQHAHIRLTLRADKSGTATLNYHRTGTKVPDSKPPHLDDCARWFGKFFKVNEQSAKIHSAYIFGEGFITTIPLPFPLVASNKGLSGLKVTGLSLEYPEDVPIENIILQRRGDEIYLFIEKKSVISLKRFDPFKELKELSSTVDSLVQKQEKTNANARKKANVRKKR